MVANGDVERSQQELLDELKRVRECFTAVSHKSSAWVAT